MSDWQDASSTPSSSTNPVVSTSDNTQPRSIPVEPRSVKFSEGERRRLAEFEAAPRVDQNAPANVPRLSAVLLASGPEADNEAVRRLLFDPPTNANQLRGKRFAILASDGLEEVELTVPYKYLHERGAGVELIAPRYERAPAKFGTQFPEQMRQTHIMIVQWMRNAGWFKVDKFLHDARVEDYDVLIIPGGTWSPDSLRNDRAALQFVRDFFNSGKLTASICHDPGFWSVPEFLMANARRRTFPLWTTYATPARSFQTSQ